MSSTSQPTSPSKRSTRGFTRAGPATDAPRAMSSRSAPAALRVGDSTSNGGPSNTSATEPSTSPNNLRASVTPRSADPASAPPSQWTTVHRPSQRCAKDRAIPITRRPSRASHRRRSSATQIRNGVDHGRARVNSKGTRLCCTRHRSAEVVFQRSRSGPVSKLFTTRSCRAASTRSTTPSTMPRTQATLVEIRRSVAAVDPRKAST